MNKQQYYQDLRQLALPISLQCLLQSSFSVVDQLMIGQLGSVSIAAVGLGGKLISLLTVMIQAIAAVAGILMAQAVGKRNQDEVRKGLYTNLLISMILAIIFTALGMLIPSKIMGIYSEDSATVLEAAGYLRIYAISFLPMTLTSLFSAYLRCRKETKIPLYAGICSAIANTVLNYLLIYGKLGLPVLGSQGAAWASVAAQIAGCIVVLATVFTGHRESNTLSPSLYHGIRQWTDYLKILMPMFVCEFLWALGENIYGYIYGHMGTDACAAMTLINPVVSLMIGALTGIAQAAGIMIGQLLGENDQENAYSTGTQLMKTGLIVSIMLSLLLILTAPYYTKLYSVEPDVREMTQGILLAFAVICPVKIANMILGGGILRSGGKTKYTMFIDMIGTWGFGVPLGFLSAFLWKFPIAWVYFTLSLEELVRLMVSLYLFKKKSWMQQL